MKLNAHIRQLLKEMNHWHSAEEFERQRVCVDDITLYETIYGSINEPGTFIVSYNCYDPKRVGEAFSSQYWKGEFAVRDAMGNPTALGRKMGIRTRDKRIPISSPRGRAIEEFLHKMAWIDANRLTRDRNEIRDETYFNETKVA